MAIKHVEFSAYGSVLGTSLTNNYTPLLTLDDDVDIVFIFNTCNETILISFDSGVTDNFCLPCGQMFSFDARTNQKRIPKAEIQVKALSTVPTSGLISITAGK